MRAVGVGTGEPPVAVPDGAAMTSGAGSTSMLLREFAATLTPERVALGDIVALMRDRAFGVAMAIFALPNTFPLAVPGMSSVLGAPLLLLSAQMMIGQTRPWMPAFLARRSISRSDFLIFIDRVLPILERAERLLRPRLVRLTSPAGKRIIGVFCFLLSVILVMPIPFGNLVPAISISLLALALIERDGVAAILGYLVGLVSIILVSTVIFALVKGFLALFGYVFAEGP